MECPSQDENLIRKNNSLLERKKTEQSIPIRDDVMNVNANSAEKGRFEFNIQTQNYKTESEAIALNKDSPEN